ncbi:MAG: hypothetical protein ACYDEJ_09585 [Desulfitobacteriaceae bacterium]
MDYPEEVCDSFWSDSIEDKTELVGKNLLLYDEHHGTARILYSAKLKDILRLTDCNTTVVILEPRRKAVAKA